MSKSKIVLVHSVTGVGIELPQTLVWTAKKGAVGARGEICAKCELPGNLRLG